jgi:hypothetical protein
VTGIPRINLNNASPYPYGKEVPELEPQQHSLHPLACSIFPTKIIITNDNTRILDIKN